MKNRWLEGLQPGFPSTLVVSSEAGPAVACSRSWRSCSRPACSCSWALWSWFWDQRKFSCSRLSCSFCWALAHVLAGSWACSAESRLSFPVNDNTNYYYYHYISSKISSLNKFSNSTCKENRVNIYLLNLICNIFMVSIRGDVDMQELLQNYISPSDQLIGYLSYFHKNLQT
jgi:hypothetical protein